MTILGRLQRVDPRTVWKHEAHDFTPWLVENIDMLGEVLGIELEVLDREADVGAPAPRLRKNAVGALRPEKEPSTTVRAAREVPRWPVLRRAQPERTASTPRKTALDAYRTFLKPGSRRPVQRPGS